MTDNKLKKYIKICGGQTVVAKSLNVHRKTVWVWETRGFPHTEWSGATTWAEQIAKLCQAKNCQVTADQILEESQ